MRYHFDSIQFQPVATHCAQFLIHWQQRGLNPNLFVIATYGRHSSWHYGSEQPDVQAYAHSYSHELGSK